MPALSQFIDGSGPVVPGKIFPFCFITIACGAISGFHTLISSGTTPKIITRESYCAADRLRRDVPGIAGRDHGDDRRLHAGSGRLSEHEHERRARGRSGRGTDTVAKVHGAGFPGDARTQMHATGRRKVGENTLFGRTGGAATLAVGMAQIFSQA